jgi:hypothetical protein
MADEDPARSGMPDRRTGNAPAQGSDDTRRIEPDDGTRAFTPPPGPPGGGTDATTRLPYRSGQQDRTRAVPAADGDRTEVMPGDGTQVLPGRAGPDGTQVMPGAAGAGAVGADRWSGRAGVPTTRPAVTETETWSEQPPRRSLMPWLIALLVLLLLALLGYGVWLAMRPRSAPASLPTPATSTRTTAAPAPTTAAPAPPPPTTQAAPPTTEAALAVIPPLQGLPVEVARATLQSLGLTVETRTETSDATPGTVVRTDPAAGTEVKAGSTVVLYVAAAPPTGSPSTSPGAGG